MPDEIGSLDIKIQATSMQAISSINRLITRLEELSRILGTVDSSSLTGLANGVSRLSTAMQAMKNVGTADFTRLAKNIVKIGSIDTVSLNNTASSLSHITRALGNLSNISQGAVSIGILAKGIAKLGYKSIQNATTNIPKLTASLIEMMKQLSKAPAVDKNIVSLANSLGVLAQQGFKVDKAASLMQGSMNKTSSGAKKTHKSFKSLASIFGSLYANFFWVIRGVKSLWSSIEKTTDYIEAYNYQAVAFGKIGSEWGKEYAKYGYSNAEEYAKSFSDRVNTLLGKMSGLRVDIEGGLLKADSAKNLGLNIQEVTQYASQLASVTNSLGQTGEATTAITKSMAMLAGDISSLFNVDYSTVATNLQSGLIGQSRALYKYGIDITNATLATYAYNLGISKSVSEMTQMEKQQLRVLAILDQSKVSWGDLANTINSPSNMLRQFKNNLSETGMVAGQLFIPIMQKIMPIVNGATIAFKRLLISIAQFAGVKIDFESFGQSGYKDESDGLEDIADGYDDVAESAKKATISLMGFDEVNKLSDSDSGDSGSTSTGNIDLTSEIVKASEEYEKVWQKAFDNMNNKAEEWAEKFESKLQFLKDIGKLIASGEYFEAGQSIADKLNEGIQRFRWETVGNFVGNSITSSLDLVSGFSKNFNWKAAARSLTSLLNGVIRSIKPSSLANAINYTVNGIWDFTITAIKTLDWKQLAKTFGKMLTELDWATIAKIGLTAGTLKLAKFAVSNLFSGIKSSLSAGMGSALGSSIESAGMTIGEIFMSGLKSPLIAIPAVIGTILIGENDYYRRITELYEKARGEVDATTQKFVDDIEETNNKIKEMSDEIYESLVNNDTTTQAEKLKIIADKYFELADGTDKSAESLKKLEEYKQYLIEEGGEEFRKILEDENSSYEDQKGKIYDVIDALKEKGRVEAASKGITETTSLIMEQQNAYDKLKGPLATAQQKMLNLQNEKQAGQSQMRAYLRKYYRNGSFQPVYNEDGTKIVKEASEVINEFWDMFDKYADIEFNEQLPSNLKKTDYEIAEIVSSASNVSKQWRDATASYEALRDNFDDSAQQLANLETQLEYYASVASGAINTQTSLYAYQESQASNTKNRFKELSGGVQSVNDVMLQAQNTSTNVVSKIESGFNPSKYVGLGRTAMSNYISGISAPELVAQGVTQANKTSSKINNGFNTKTSMKQTGIWSLQGLIEGFKDTFTNSTLFKTIENITEKIKKNFKLPFKISSPSKVFKQYGEWTLEGYNIGFNDIAKDTYKMVNGWGDKIASVPGEITGFETEFSTDYSKNISVEYGSSEQTALLKEQNSLLRALLEKETVILPDETGIFTSVRKQVNSYIRQTGDMPWLT